MTTTNPTAFNPCNPGHYHLAPREAQQQALELHLAGGPAEAKPSAWQLVGADLLHLLALSGIVVTSVLPAMVIRTAAPWLTVVVVIAGLALAVVAATWVEHRLPALRDHLARKSNMRYDMTVRLAETLQLPRERLSPAITHELAMLRRNARARELSSPELRPFVDDYICRYRPGLTELSRRRLPPRPMRSPAS